MTDKTPTLPPEVAEAIERLGTQFVGTVSGGRSRTVIAHLHRLAEENARLRESAQQIERECLEAWEQATHSRSCAKVAEAELADVRRKWADAESKLAACDDDLRHVLAERDALKARIAEARFIEVGDTGENGTFKSVWFDFDEGGTRYALLPLEDEAKSCGNQ